MISPTPLWQVIGQIIAEVSAGYCRRIVLTMPIDTGLIFNGWSFLIMFLNGAVFSAIGGRILLAKRYADGLSLQYVSTERLPGFLGKFVPRYLPRQVA